MNKELRKYIIAFIALGIMSIGIVTIFLILPSTGLLDSSSSLPESSLPVTTPVPTEEPVQEEEEKLEYAERTDDEVAIGVRVKRFRPTEEDLQSLNGLGYTNEAAEKLSDGEKVKLARGFTEYQKYMTMKPVFSPYKNVSEPTDSERMTILNDIASLYYQNDLKALAEYQENILKKHTFEDPYDYDITGIFTDVNAINQIRSEEENADGTSLKNLYHSRTGTITVILDCLTVDYSVVPELVLDKNSEYPVNGFSKVTSVRYYSWNDKDVPKIVTNTSADLLAEVRFEDPKGLHWTAYVQDVSGIKKVVSFKLDE